MKFFFFMIIFLHVVSIVYSQTNIVSIVNKSGKYYLVNPQKDYTSVSYDSISYDQTYFKAYNKNLIAIYSRDTFKLIIDSVRSMHKISRLHKNYQLLVGNKIVWLNERGSVLAKNPNEIVKVDFCGTVPHFIRLFYKIGDSSFLDLTAIGSNQKIHKNRTHNITSLVQQNTLLYLNNSEELRYSTNNEFLAELDQNIFFEKTPNQQLNIIQLSFNGRKFSKTVLVSSIDKCYEMSKRSDFNAFHPFIFQKENLYGYFPMTKTARYLFVNPLDDNFARFQLTSGEMGWLAIDGMEYLDK